MNFCTTCGTQRNNRDNFCEKCGKNFNSDNSNEVSVQETLHPASGWKTPEKELEESKNLDSSSFQRSVPRKRLITASVAIIAIFLGSASLYFSGLIGGNASESKKTSDYIQSWLLSNGFCTDVLGSSMCYYEDDAYPQRDDLAENYPRDYPLPVMFDILTGDVNVPDYALKESIYTDNWVIQVETHEVAFPGTFDKGREMMKQIASGLNGKLHSGYHPRDFCTFEIYFISVKRLYDKSFRPSAEQDAIISECRKYFPEAPKEEFRH